MALESKRSDLTGGPRQPLFTIPGSNLTCSGKVDCSVCSKQIWISCQPQGHILVFVDQGHFKDTVRSESKGEVLVQELSDIVTESENLPYSLESTSVVPTASAASSIKGKTQSIENVKESEVTDKENSEKNDDNDSNSIYQLENKKSQSRKSGSKHSRRTSHDQHHKVSPQSEISVLDRPSTCQPTQKKHLRSLPIDDLRKETFSQTFSVDHTNGQGEPRQRKDKESPCQKKGSKRKENLANSNRPTRQLYVHCELCNSNTKTFRYMKSHLKNHMKLPNYACDLCGKIFRHGRLLRVHRRRVHDGLKPYSCDFCDKHFYSKTALKSHRNTHVRNESYVCHVCGKSISNPRNLKRHLICHTGVKDYSCEFCGMKFYQKTDKVSHVRCHHTGETPYVCEICGDGFREAYLLKYHLHRHKEGKPIPSRHLEPSSMIMMTEKYGIVGKPYYCRICKIQYTIGGWYTHLKSVHSDGLTFQCSYQGSFCNKTFKSRQGLDDHIRTHTKEKPFKCTLCDKAFSQRTHRATHQLVHTGEKPHKCEICGRAFALKGNLTAHMKTHNKQQKPLKVDMQFAVVGSHQE